MTNRNYKRICDECGHESFGNVTVHIAECSRRSVLAAYPPIRSGHRDAPDCNCIACALKRGEDRD